MSRTPAFPPQNRRPRSPGSAYGDVGPQLSPPTRPLQINRSVTPNGGTSYSNSAMSSSTSSRGVTSPNGPSRPQRSVLRSRQNDYSDSERASGSNRDSIATSFSDAPQYRQRSGTPDGSRPNIDTSRPPQRPRYQDDTRPSPVSPKAMSAVMDAFKGAGQRNRTNTMDSERDAQRQRELELEQVRQQRIRDRAPGRRTNGKARTGDIDAVLDQIKDGWEFVVDPEFNSVDLALQLLDDSSLGKDMKSFIRTKDMLSKALKGSVDKHYQAFAAALPHHATLLNHLVEAQTQMNDARSALAEAKEALGSKRADLVQLWSRGQTLEEMMRILDQIEHLKTVPDSLETLISEKRLLQAAVLLVRSLKTINRPDMQEIGAVSDLRGYLMGQETALREILIDELHSHLYLKSFWCESRWSAYVPNQTTFPKIEFEEELLTMDAMKPESETPPPTASFRTSRLTRFLNDLTLRPNDSPHDINEALPRGGNALHMNAGPAVLTNYAGTSATLAQRNPEADSFAYIEILLESLAVLSKLGSALDIVAQRLPVEIFGLVETTLDEVAERAEYGRRGSLLAVSNSIRQEGAYIYSSNTASGGIGSTLAPQGGLVSSSALRLAALESSAKQADHEILNDFFWTVYSKLDAVSQGLRVVYEVSNRIGSRRDFRDSSGAKPGSLFPLAEIWTPVQAEVRSLLYEYLSDDEQSSVSGRNPISSINEILRGGRFTRDRSVNVFRFGDTDFKQTNKTLKKHEDELMRVIKDTMPGLVQGSSENAVQSSLTIVGSEDRLTGLGQRHRLLIKPDAFHVTVLFQPTLTFLDRVSTVLPSGMDSAHSSSAVLDQFVLNVYLPQLEEKVAQLFHQAVSGPDAFQPDPASTRLADEPLVKSSTQLMALINSLCVMLRTTPFHRESYARLILGVIIQFYQKCSDKFQDLVSIKSNEDPPRAARLTLAAQWAQKSELTPCLSELVETPATDTAKLHQLCKQETHLELNFLGKEKIMQPDLLASTRNHSVLGNLYRSIIWFAEQLNALQTPTDELVSPVNSRYDPGATPITPFITPPPLTVPSESLSLPLSRNMSLRFQALLKTYEILAGLILDTMRIDVRCRAIHYLSSTMRNGNYSLDQEATEPGIQILDLNEDLNKCDAFIKAALPVREQNFIFAGLGHLMEDIMISYTSHIRKATSFGIKKISRNMLALQQSIRTISKEADNTEFARAKRYYSLFSLTPTEMLQGVRRRQEFTFDEYKAMLNLQCGVDALEGEAGVARATDRNYSMYVIELHGMELENFDDGDH